jgi:uncharacterized damage-inducible protein DinB
MYQDLNDNQKMDREGGMPNGRLRYALENHIIHHRGQCVVYLQLWGITPVGYLGS